MDRPYGSHLSAWRYRISAAQSKEIVMGTDVRIQPDVTRRGFNSASLLSLAMTVAASLPGAAAAQPIPAGTASSRRDVIKQTLPGEPQRDISLVEVTYAPGA